MHERTSEPATSAPRGELTLPSGVRILQPVDHGPIVVIDDRPGRGMVWELYLEEATLRIVAVSRSGRTEEVGGRTDLATLLGPDAADAVIARLDDAVHRRASVDDPATQAPTSSLEFVRRR